MNYKTIRAYQFKADAAVTALEAAGAVWTVGSGKPQWVLPKPAEVDVEAIKKEARKEFLAEIMQIGAEKKKPVFNDDFEIGTDHFPNRLQHIGRFAELIRIPSWHGLPANLLGSKFRVDEIKHMVKSRYTGYAVSGKVGGQPVWFPLSCIKFL